MSIRTTTKLILEICDYIIKNGEEPPRGTLSSDGRDMGNALKRYRSREIPLNEAQIGLLAAVDDFLARTEKNIRELEEFYRIHGHLPLGDTYIKYKGIMDSYKNGVVPVTEKQKERLEKIGVFLSNTERMIRAIENYYTTYHKIPSKDAKSPEGYNMHDAIKGYKSGKRKLTFDQKKRIEALGIPLPNAVIKEETVFHIRTVSEKVTLADQIEQLKKERKALFLKDATLKHKNK